MRTQPHTHTDTPLPHQPQPFTPALFLFMSFSVVIAHFRHCTVVGHGRGIPPVGLAVFIAVERSVDLLGIEE